MRARELRWLAAISAAVAAVSIPVLDMPIARAIHGSAIEDAWVLQRGTWLLDWLTGKEIWRFLLAALLTVPGLALMLMAARRELGAKLVFVGAVHGLASLVVLVAKPLFGRVRPDGVLVDGALHPWFAAGDSFPSGHTAFYFGLFLPLAWLWPKQRAALLVVPIFIGLARIDANEHFLADVCASIALSCLLTLAVAWLLRGWLPRDL